MLNTHKINSSKFHYSEKGVDIDEFNYMYQQKYIRNNN